MRHNFDNCRVCYYFALQDDTKLACRQLHSNCKADRTFTVSFSPTKRFAALISRCRIRLLCSTKRPKQISTKYFQITASGNACTDICGLLSFTFTSFIVKYVLLSKASAEVIRCCMRINDSAYFCQILFAYK